MLKKFVRQLSADHDIDKQKITRAIQLNKEDREQKKKGSKSRDKPRSDYIKCRKTVARNSSLNGQAALNGVAQKENNEQESEGKQSEHNKISY